VRHIYRYLARQEVARTEDARKAYVSL
jgi:hypothetical protein